MSLSRQSQQGLFESSLGRGACCNIGIVLMLSFVNGLWFHNIQTLVELGHVIALRDNEVSRVTRVSRNSVQRYSSGGLIECPLVMVR